MAFYGASFIDMEPMAFHLKTIRPADPFIVFFFLFCLLCLCRTQYITTVIPYHPGNGPPSNPTVQVLIKSKS